MVAILSLQQPAESFEPGEVSTTSITIRNAGTEVDAFMLEAVGPIARFVEFSSPSVNLVPNDEETVIVSFSLPRAPQPAAGPIPFAVKATPGKQPTEPTTAECTIDVAAFMELDAELTPRNSRGSRRGRHEFAVDNSGNLPLALEFSGFDDNEALRIEASPESSTLEPGDTAYVGVRVKPRKRFLRGPDRIQQFKMLTASAELEPRFDSAAFTQRPLFPKWFWKVLLLALVLLILLLLLFLLAKNSIESSAREVAEAAAQEALSDGGAAPGGGAPSAVDPGAGDPGGGGGAPDDDPAGAGPPDDGSDGGGGVVTGSVAFRLTTADSNFPVAADGFLVITDILFSNPDGESGRVQVLRGGAVLLESDLRNFRDLDQHFRTPLVFDEANPLSVSINCGTPACTSSVTFSGAITD